MLMCVYACVPVCVRSVVLLLAVEQNTYYFITLPSYGLSMTDCDCKVIRCCTGYNTILVNSEHTQVCAHVTAAHASSAAFSAIPISAVHMSC